MGADNGNGYGQFSFNGKNGYAHRYAWEREHGPIPNGLTVDHLCRVRCCVNVDHLELVDGPENTRRGVAARPRATHCKRNHEYAVVGRNAQGDCRACVDIRQRDRWNRQRKSPPGEDIRVRYDQNLVREVIDRIRAAEITIAQGAREIGCNANYLGRRAWKETKAAVIERDKSCVMCSVADALDVHHRINRGAGGSARPEISFGMANLIALCRRDHSWVTDNTVEARERGGWCLLRTDSPEASPVLWHGAWKLLTVDGGIDEAEATVRAQPGPLAHCLPIPQQGW
ncbi:HNH endonuclease [Mycobacterium sp. IS-836]|uniref:HNH endonuclease n=1 Tax=Mycobacterium sp. IS-836 TaxID=1834160 RepID=UPI00096FB78C